MVFECCVKGCGTVARNGLHSFPSNKLVAEKWIMAIKRPNLMERLRANTLSFHKICKKHFNDTDFHLNGKEQRVVNPNSIPSLFLPDDDDVSYQEQRVVKPNSIPSLFLLDDDDHQTARMPSKPVKRLQQQLSYSKSYRNATKQSGNKPASDKGNDGMDIVNDIEMTTLDNDSDVDVVGLDSDMEICSNEGVDLNSTKGRKVTKITNGPNFSYYKKRVKELGQKVKKNKINDTVVLNYLRKKFNKTLFVFFKMQLTNCGRSRRGRRYTLEEKSLCLAMYKHGPKSYRFKEKWSALPTNRTLGRYSAKLIFKSGVDRNMLEAVKNVVKDWPENDKYCSIVWDEVSLKEHLDHNQSQDYIEGFVEMNTTKKPIFATHALTFMVRGLNRSYKQAMGNFYTNGIKSFELVELVKLMIAESLKTGLKPILSICDQCNINASTVNALANPANPSTKQLGGLLQYKVNGHQLIHGYDPSHLIKVTRNNLQKKNLAHFISKRWQSGDKEKIGSLQIAAWDDLNELYRMGRLPKLTDEHLKPLKLKMKVSLATQVFSNTCGSVMLRHVQQGILPEHFTSTAQLLLFMNDLFDSINGSDNGNTLKSAVTENSIHFEFWDYALSMLQNMFFVDKYTGDRNDNSSVLKKFESTIRAYKEIAKICFDLNIPSVNIRDTTQDGLENFFGCVKSCNQNNKATPAQYRTGYNTMTIINITGTNSLHTNCLPDQSSPILTNFHDFISKFKRETINVSNSQSLIDVDVDDMILFDPLSDEEDETEAIINYKDLNTMIAFDPQSDLSDEENELTEREDTIAFNAQCLQAKVDFVEYEAISSECALICQKLIKFTGCEKCKNNIQSIAETALISCVEKIICSLNKIIPHICFEDSLKTKLLSHIESIKIDFIGCSEHNQEISQKIKSLSADRIILTFCNGINKILSGKIDTLPVNHNYMEKLAYDHRMKKKRIDNDFQLKGKEHSLLKPNSIPSLFVPDTWCVQQFKTHFKDNDFQLNGKEHRVVKPNSIPKIFVPDNPRASIRSERQMMNEHFGRCDSSTKNTNYWSQNQRHQQNISSLSPSQRTVSSLSPPAAVVDGTFKEEQKPVRNRISFSKKQLLALEKEFAKNTHPTRGRIMELAVHLHLTERRVRVWYTNRRSKYRRNVQKECDRNSFEGYHRNLCFNDQSLPSLNNILFPSNEQNPEPIPPRTQKIRTPRKFSQNQLVAMEKEFAKIRNPPRHRLIELANSLELTEQRVKIWFKNRRSKDIKNCKNQNRVKDNLQHAVIATTVMDKIEKTDIAEPIQQNVCFPNSFDGYGGNFNLDQQLNNHYFSNSFPFNDNQHANYIDYVGPNLKQYPNPPITDTFFNYDGGIHYNTLNDSKYESTNL